MPSDSELILAPTKSTLMLLMSLLDAKEGEDLQVRLLLSASSGKEEERGLRKPELIRRKRLNENSTQGTTTEGGCMNNL